MSLKPCLLLPLQDAVPEEDQPELMDKISRGEFTMRIMYEQFANITKMGPMSQVRCSCPPSCHCCFIVRVACSNADSGPQRLRLAVGLGASH